jgi:glycine/D-amino acid oxidase-like deaminating enzyme/nitrite reductase/ring-hydroxylating ferredoxin subunit
MESLWLQNRARQGLDAWEPDAHYDAVVVGAGLTGLTSALLLSRSGMRVAVLEARHVGAVTTGHSTAKLSLLQGSVLSGIRHHSSEKVVDAYVEGNREGQSWLLRYLADHDVAVQRRTAYTYATTSEGSDVLDRELEVAVAAGLPVERTDDPGLPYTTRAALQLDDQAQFNPMDVLAAMVDDLRDRGSRVIEGVRVHDVDTGDPTTVSTDRGVVSCGEVILATGTPILDRGLYFAKLIPSRSYAAAYRLPGGDLPSGMYLSVDAPTRSLRTAELGGETLLITGGNGHIVGREPSTRACVDDLYEWTLAAFPGAERTHRWSAQDYQSVNMVPFVGWLPRGRGRVFVATGYNKWGMTNAVAAALSLSSDILGGDIPWAKTLHHRVTRPSSLATGASFNAGVAMDMVKGWGEAETARPHEPGEGEGVIHHDGMKPVAVSMVGGKRSALSAVCTHLDGIVSWNDAERTWDCPLHGSRFAADGTLLEGSATENLAQR